MRIEESFPGDWREPYPFLFNSYEIDIFFWHPSFGGFVSFRLHYFIK